MNNRLIHIISALLVFAVAFVALAPLGRQNDKQAVLWMKELDDSLAVRDLSIPGSHDSGALHSIGDVSGKCQSLSIEDQLSVGVRFLDIRLRLVGDEFKIVHSFVDQATDFDDTLRTVVEFIENNPSEFLFVSIKEDKEAKNPKGDFATLLEATLAEYDTIARDTSVPDTVGKARGRIFIISRYEGATIGIPAYDGWLDSESFAMNEIYVQDEYKVESAEEKQEAVEAALSVAGEKSYALVLNFSSCYLTTESFPPTYAATVAQDMNPYIKEKADSHDGTMGVVICDFVTDELVKAIWEVNFR